jgi:RimJ/RimL family protein N-acetyltransferase
MITFEPLHAIHLPLLLKWLEESHVKKWWDANIKYTIDLVKEKYEPYINGDHQSIHAFIICINNIPIGYIQLYNPYDFMKDNPVSNLPENLGGIDMFIGELSYLKKGIGLESLRLFLNNYAFKAYQYIFVDPDYVNVAAVRLYEKVGFVIIKRVKKTFWMVAHQKTVRLSIQDSIALENAFRKYFLKEDCLWVFGSRANLSKRGGDIDLYIETHFESVDAAYEAKKDFLIEFENVIGEQKIDIVLNRLNSHYSLPIYEIAKTKGVKIL